MNRDANRLTDTDRLHITQAVRTFATATERMEPAERFTTAERVAHHAIGCSSFDLRDAELDEIAATVQALLAPAHRPDPAHIDGADMWDCPCRECTRLDHDACGPGHSLAQHRYENHPEHYPPTR
jgi:hypothetical protein